MRIVIKVLVLTWLLAGCIDQQGADPQQQKAEYSWTLITSWPKHLPGLGSAPDRFAEEVKAMSNGRLDIKVYGAGELYPALDVFKVVSAGGAEMGHSAAYYWQNELPAAVFFSSVPFGMSAKELNAWLYLGGGLALWQELYAPHNLIPFPGGNTDAQMGGWYNKKVTSINDFKQLKMRIPGLGGKVLELAGGLPTNLPAGELYTALQSGELDAVEWVGPYNDLAFGFHKVAKYYYYPGWHEPSTTLEFVVNQDAFAALPVDLQRIIENATKVVNQETLNEYVVYNIEALNVLANEHGVEVVAFPDDVLALLKDYSVEVIQQLAQQDRFFEKVLNSYQRFQFGVLKYNQVELDPTTLE
ncbi:MULTISPECIES: TRAP transporter substrate-binding protein [unclassified Agarivorans]|uniref:TRAP transporter substrate-binding protein n=1 Tax=unclassified Agarivorans TaxID=2636026 RepID=UPI0026E287FE|nr:MULTISPECIES: TRAP transporter substrate-binding protein [unclassified Agarivorans]MDO6684048.1 TRAP transporter substrate-binding protein [Agarivorans sp. 3_MG-2023]MDO6714218.1 TRAP transporter substrate-binding protein [Agarivorans sp. 2_MG-2023]